MSSYVVNNNDLYFTVRFEEMVCYTLCIMYKGEIINPNYFIGCEKEDLFDTVMFEVMVSYILCIMYLGEIIYWNDFICSEQ